MNLKLTLTGFLACLVLAASASADGMRSWSKEQHPQPKSFHDCGKGCIYRFNHTVDAADQNYEEQGWEAASYWSQQARKAKHHTISYKVDLGDLYRRLGQDIHGLSQYHLAHHNRRKTTEDNVELGLAFLDANRPGLADYYFNEAAQYARSKHDWRMIYTAYDLLGNSEMAAMAKKKSNMMR